MSRCCPTHLPPARNLCKIGQSRTLLIRNRCSKPCPHHRGSASEKVRHGKMGSPMFAWLFSDPLPIGSRAPGFSLQDETGKAVTLSSLHGQNVVLVFYPGDDTMVCRK